MLMKIITLNDGYSLACNDALISWVCFPKGEIMYLFGATLQQRIDLSFIG
jgi:hypothetical protein